MPSAYQQEKIKIYTSKIRETLPSLPGFCAEFFRGIENTTSVLTRYAYAIDLKLFFTFLIEHNLIAASAAHLISLQDFNELTAEHIEMFLEYLNYYVADQDERENKEQAKKRKLSTLRSLCKFFFKKEKIEKNIAALVDMPKIHEKPIIRLEANEVADLLDFAESGEKLSAKQRVYHKLTKVRDLAILTLFLSTGIRISELVGLNIGDIDFERNAFVVTRKGGNQVVLYFYSETKDALAAYMEERRAIPCLKGHEDAFFLSTQHRRVTARSVQNLVKKYSRAAVPLKGISPHKLRSTYGTMLYQQTDDIYLVAEVLGHKDINTTKKHYAAMDEERRRMAAKVVKLRKD